MKNKYRRAIALLTFCLIAGGCWDHQPPETSAFILMLGLDTDPEDPMQTVVTQMAVIPTALAAGDQSGQAENTAFYLLSNKATTLESAQASIFDHLSRVPRLDHMDALVLGQEFARAGRGTAPAIAWALRHPQLRPGTLLFVAVNSAQEFLDARPVLDPLPGAALTGLMRHADRVHFVYPTRAYEFARTLLTPRVDGAIPLIGRVNPLAARVSPDFQQQSFLGGGTGDGNQSMETQVQLLGMAIFKGSRMVGTLTADDGSGLIWIRGDSKAVMSIPHPGQHPDAYIFALAVRSSVKRSARFDGNRLTLSIESQVIMDVWGEGFFEPMGVGKYLSEIDRDLAGMIENNMRRTMQRLQELQADIFGFGEELYRASPADWDKVADVWDDLYADAELDIRVSVDVRRTGLTR